MEPQVTGQTPGTNIDPTALALSRSIRQVESGGDYNAKGDNGTSFGAYQFHGDNFKNWATQYGLDPTDKSPTNQDHLAYLKIKSGLDSGLSQSEVAAQWNGAKMVNGRPQAINPDYVKKVQAEYEKQSTVGGQSSQAGNGLGAFTPQSQSEGQETQTSQPSTDTSQSQSSDPGFWSNLTSGNIGGVVGDVFNGAFPVVGDVAKDIQGKSDKSALQQLGDLGMSSLWFLPFGDIAEGLGAGAEALGASKGVASAAGAIGTGLGTGYAGDVSSNLAQGKTGLSAAQPGLGTLLGGGLAGAGLGAGAIYNKFLGEQNVVDNVTKAYEDAGGATKTGIQGMTGKTSTAAKGLDPNPEFLANAGIPPETAEVNGRRVFTTGVDSASQQTINDRIGALSELRDKATAQSGMTINPNDLRQSMLSQAEKDFSGTALQAAQNHINNEMDALSIDPKYKVDGNGNLNSQQATEMKSYLASNMKYDATRPSNIAETYGTMAKVARTSIENAAEQAGTPSIKELNHLIQQHYDSLTFLNKINGQTVKGGRLGGYFARTVGAVVGSSMGGSGVIGKALGGLGGEEAGGMISRFMQKMASGGPMAAATMGRMAKADPEIVQKFLGFLGNEGGAQVAPMVQPTEETAGSLLGNFLKKRSITGTKK